MSPMSPRRPAVQHLIFSSLLGVTKETGGRLKHVPHFDQKAHVEGYILEIGVPAMFVLPVYFMNSYTQIPLLREGEDGVYTLAYPIGEGARFPLVDIVRDMGKFVAAALKNRSETLGTQILSAADYYTPTRILAEFEEVTGKKTRFVQVDSETYKNFMPGLMGEEKLENHLFIERSGYYGGRSLKESHDLLGKAGFKTSSWKDFLLEKTSLF
ncbi:NmrA-like family domain-containing protein 1 [Penicillium subrubescens]|uniref:NmrA-like family domain-containing protein 1 n=1 Tax=Penicillium subrubescens TaxID=1316194 RepID=A0A1Q5UNI3_9EURO|nr:NmrA-like family domain-containing protein 1 [Penicillium subrubescens]